MNKLYFIALIFVVLISGLVYFYIQDQRSVIRIGPCEGYTEVGKTDQIVKSENESKQIALDYYSSIGYNFSFEDIGSRKISDYWYVWYNISKINRSKICKSYIMVPYCIGEIKIEQNTFSENKILMRYIVPC